MGGSGRGLIRSLTIDMANRGKPQPRQMDGPRPEQDLYRIQGRRNTDTANLIADFQCYFDDTTTTVADHRQTPDFRNDTVMIMCGDDIVNISDM